MVEKEKVTYEPPIFLRVRIVVNVTNPTNCYDTTPNRDVRWMGSQKRKIGVGVYCSRCSADGVEPRSTCSHLEKSSQSVWS